MTKNDIHKEFQAALSEYKTNIDFAIETSRCDNETCELVHEAAKQTYYVLDRFAELFEKHHD